jgi:hypothetical protein
LGHQTFVLAAEEARDASIAESPVQRSDGIGKVLLKQLVGWFGATGALFGGSPFGNELLALHSSLLPECSKCGQTITRRFSVG